VYIYGKTIPECTCHACLALAPQTGFDQEALGFQASIDQEWRAVMVGLPAARPVALSAPHLAVALSLLKSEDSDETAP
jgi:hypothetical protein